MKHTMFDRLLTLPLFQGLGHDDLTRILESTHFEFQTLPSGTYIVRQDEPCNGVTFVLQGSVKSATLSADRSWSVEEFIPTPSVIGLESLYGSVRTFQRSYSTHAPTRLMLVDKRTIAALTAYYEVFRINFLNTLSATIARQQQPLWQPATLSLKSRIVQFMRLHVQRPAGNKRFLISMRTLGNYLGEDYRYISKALHELLQSNLIELQRNLIIVPSFEDLLKAKL